VTDELVRRRIDSRSRKKKRTKPRCPRVRDSGVSKKAKKKIVSSATAGGREKEPAKISGEIRAGGGGGPVGSQIVPWGRRKKIGLIFPKMGGRGQQKKLVGGFAQLTKVIQKTAVDEKGLRNSSKTSGRKKRGRQSKSTPKSS